LARWLRYVQPQDLVWLLLFLMLGYALPNHDAYDIGPLVGLAAVQLIAPKTGALDSTRSRIVWLVLNLLFAYVLIGYTGALDSRYWLVMVLPVASAGTVFGAFGTLLFSIVCASAYLSFLLWPHFLIQEVVEHLQDTNGLNELALRVIFLAVVGNLANTLARQLRLQSEKHRRTAEQLAQANQQIQEQQESLRRSDRLAALGQLTAGLAHELRNPLGTIKASSDMLNHNLKQENEVAREVAGFIGSEVDRANSLITRFLNFARPLQLQTETGDLSRTIDRAIALVERDAPQITIYRNYAPEMVPFSFDPELMERVFFNLIQNAAQATTPGGTITVKTRMLGRSAEISVIDRGSGIDPKNLETIFNPFFTTKSDGVGLGLAIVSKIVDEHGGKITVESEPGKGSIFQVLLPMDRPAAPAPTA